MASSARFAGDSGAPSVLTSLPSWYPPKGHKKSPSTHRRMKCLLYPSDSFHLVSVILRILVRTLIKATTHRAITPSYRYASFIRAREVPTTSQISASTAGHARPVIMEWRRVSPFVMLGHETPAQPLPQHISAPTHATIRMVGLSLVCFVNDPPPAGSSGTEASLGPAFACNSHPSFRSVKVCGAPK